MTGFGTARRLLGERSATVEIRAVNNRFFKCNLRVPDAVAAWEPEIERLIRETINRGTVQLTLRVERPNERGRYQFDEATLAGYLEQARTLSLTWGTLCGGIDSLFALPGVVVERESIPIDPQADRDVLFATLGEALAALHVFRQTEGEAMAREIRLCLAGLRRELAEIEAVAPMLVQEFRDRLHSRVRELLRGTEASVSDADLIREVSLFADRSDITEELARLRSHLSQFESFLEDSTSQGRKLEFLTQELGREVNTIGSKANSVAISHRVVEMKATMEKIREILANIE